jgi:hypothetical protein
VTRGATCRRHLINDKSLSERPSSPAHRTYPTASCLPLLKCEREQDLHFWGERVVRTVFFVLCLRGRRTRRRGL